MKRRFGLLAVCFCIVLAVLATGVTAFAGHQCNRTLVIGDVNLDGSVNSTDLSVLMQEINEQVIFNLFQNITADVNNDAGITMLDYNMLQEYIQGTRTSFPAGTTYTVYFGDVTGDQICTTADSTKVSDFILGRTTLTAREYCAADVNGNGVVNSIDLGVITQYLNNQIYHFPVWP